MTANKPEISDVFSIGYRLTAKADQAYLCIHTRYRAPHKEPGKTFFEGCSLDYVAGYLDGAAFFKGHKALLRNGLTPEEDKLMSHRYEPLATNSIEYLVENCEALRGSGSASIQREGMDHS